MRQRAAEIIEAVRDSDEPTVVLQRSRKLAYLVGAESYEALQAELRAARRQLFLREVREAEAEYATGALPEYDDVEDLLTDIAR